MNSPITRVIGEVIDSNTRFYAALRKTPISADHLIDTSRSPDRRALNRTGDRQVTEDFFPRVDHLSDNPRYRGVHRLQSITSPITRYRAGHRQQTEAVQNFFPCAPSISNLRVATLLKICNSFYCRSPNISFRLSSD